MITPEDNITIEQPKTVTVGGKTYSYKLAVLGLAKRAQKFYLASSLTPKYEDTGKDVPDEYWLLLRAKNVLGANAAIGGQEFTVLKTNEGSWKIHRIVSAYERDVESPEWQKLNEDWKVFCGMILVDASAIPNVEDVTMDELLEVGNGFFPFQKTPIPS